MRSLSRSQLYLIIGTLLITAFIYFAPREGSKAKVNVEQAKSTSFSFESLMEESKKHFSSETSSAINSLEMSLKGERGKSIVIEDSLVNIWDKQNVPAIAAYYAEQIATKEPTEKHWLNAAYRYFDGFKNSTDSFEFKALVDKAINAYSKVLEFNPDNLDAKTDLGICYADGTSNPMKGIGLLREVVAKNPKHENAQMNLGILAVKSAQFDKALARFDTVLLLNPNRFEMYSFIGDVYLRKGNKEKAIENFEKYKSYLKDTLKITDVNNYIKEIKAAKE